MKNKMHGVMVARKLRELRNANHSLAVPLKDLVKSLPTRKVYVDSSCVCARLLVMRSEINNDRALQKVAARILPEYAKEGRHEVVCFGTRICMEISEVDIVFKGLDNVPSGVVFLSEKQRAESFGWA